MRFTNAPPVSLTTATVQLAAGTKVALATGAVVALAAGTTVGLPAGQKVGVTGDVALAAGSTVALAATTEVKLATGAEVKLAAGSAVKVSTAVTVAGATASGQSAPAFVGRTASASSTALGTAVLESWRTLIPAPASSRYIELHGFTCGSSTPAKLVQPVLSTAATLNDQFAVFFGVNIAFDFQGATLPPGAGIYLYSGENSGTAQVNYTIRT